MTPETDILNIMARATIDGGRTYEVRRATGDGPYSFLVVYFDIFVGDDVVISEHTSLSDARADAELRTATSKMHAAVTALHESGYEIRRMKSGNG